MSNEFEWIKGIIERQIALDNISVEFTQKRGNLPKISIKGWGFKNPILDVSLQSSIKSNLSAQISVTKRKRLYLLWKNKEKSKQIKEKWWIKILLLVVSILALILAILAFIGKG